MTASAPHTVLVTLTCPDRTGLIAALAGALFDLGANLGDTTFAVLGEAAEYSAIADLRGDVSAADVQAVLEALPEVAGGRLSVVPFDMAATHGPSARITHRVLLSGGDTPGLIARLAEVFVQYKANVVRLNSERLPAASETRYVVRAALNIPAEAETSCMATVVNTAGELGLSCTWETA
jgi:glycine cleavage system transcriptional repressor